ncbi:MAG TPA: fused MFS/spermidine synthase, partial [Gemmatimonadaceae bacterium]
MNPRSVSATPPTDRSARILPFLLALFVGSGCAALIYEIVWFQVLQLVIGSSAVSLAVLLGTFMGGMCAGSLLLARFVSRVEHPLRVYARLEALIGVCGAALIVLMPLVSRLYTAVDGGGPSSIVLRAIVCVLLLLPPTVLMGATLPAMSRFVEATPKGVSWLGFFYGGNIVGAVVGCLTAGFFLLRKFDLSTASLVAVALNVTVAGLGFLLSRRAAYSAPRDEVEPGAPAAPWQPRGVFVAIALSGLTALGAEVVWTRLLSLMFGATTYAFSIILAVFLAGLGGGSVIGSWLGRDVKSARAAFGWTQLLLGLSTAWGAFMIAKELPWWPINERLATNVWLVFQVDMARALYAVAPGALLWGASFPLALAAASGSISADPGRTVGRVYAANTLGAIVGSLVTGLVLIPWIGTKGAQQVFIVVSVVSGVVVLLPMMRQRALGGAGVAMAGALSAVALFFAASVSAVPTGLIAWGRSLSWQGAPNALYWGEGMNASIAVTEEVNGWRNFHVSGKVEASTEPQDMRLQRLLGHLSGLMHDNPKDVLVVGFGAGVTAGALSIHPTVERMVICEMEPLIPKVVSTYFSVANHAVADSKKVSVVYDDARHYVLTTRRKFDVITSDPIHPWVKGAATLYTKEYFEHVKAHLNPGGVVTQWVPLYESTPDVVRSELATFFSVFPNGTVWRNDNTDGSGYDVVLVARMNDKPIDVDAWQARLMQPDYAPVKVSLMQVGFGSAFDVLGSYIGRGPELARWLTGADINKDSNLRLQYLAGLGYNEFRGTEIRDAIMQYRAFPTDLFVGSPAS